MGYWKEKDIELKNAAIDAQEQSDDFSPACSLCHYSTVYLKACEFCYKQVCACCRHAAHGFLVCLECVTPDV